MYNAGRASPSAGVFVCQRTQLPSHHLHHLKEQGKQSETRDLSSSETHLPFVYLLCLQVCSEEAVKTLISLNILIKNLISNNGRCLAIKSLYQLTCKIEAGWER